MNFFFNKAIKIISIITISQSYLLYCVYSNYQNKYYLKIKKVIEDKTHIFNKRVKNKIILDFINIAKRLNINLDDNISNDNFDIIYYIYTNNIFIINKKIL